MTVYVYRNGQIVPRDDDRAGQDSVLDRLPAPHVITMESYDSPVDGRSISSHRQRDWDMKRVDAVDRRDLDRKPFEEREARNARLRETPAEWS